MKRIRNNGQAEMGVGTPMVFVSTILIASIASQAANKAVRAELAAVCRDMAGMNEVIRNPLSIYETVCRGLNPFRDDDPFTLIEVPGDGKDGRKGQDQ